MIRVNVKGTSIYGVAEYPITSGSVGRKVKFEFDESWNDLLKIGVFTCNNVTREVELNSINECVFPWECLVHENVDQRIQVGIYGMRGEELIYPTIYTGVGNLVQGTVITGETSVPYTPTAIEQAIAKSQKALDLIATILEQDQLIKLVETSDELSTLDANVNLAFVRTNRHKFTPATLKSDELYGDSLYIDPLLINFFPCEPFEVFTEHVSYFHCRIATDGRTWLTIDKLYDTGVYTRLIFNATEEPITVDGVEYSSAGWHLYASRYDDVAALNPYIDKNIYSDFILNNVMFSSDAHFEDLQKIISSTPVYTDNRGLYQNNHFNSWLKIDVESLSIGLTELQTKSHDHSVKYDGAGKVSVSFSSGNSTGGGNIGTGGGNPELT